AEGAARVQHEASHDRESQPRAARFGRVEVVERAIELVARHPPARVRDRYANAGAIRLRVGRPRGNGDLAYPRCEAVESVSDEVLENAADHERVRARGTNSVRQLQAHLGLTSAPQAADCVAHHRVHVTRLAGGLGGEAGGTGGEGLEGPDDGGR